MIDRSQDALGRDKGFTLNAGSTVENQATYGYSATTGRLEAVEDTASAFRYDYLANSNLIETLTATAGAVHSAHNAWEPNRDILDLKQNKVGSTVISQYDYRVNAIGQRSGVSQAGTAFQAVRSIAWTGS